MAELSDPIFYDAIDGVRDPRAHDLVVGHDDAHRQMRQAIASERLPQAWLLSGPRGVGKATFAWHYARRLAKSTDASQAPTTDELAAYGAGRHFQIYDIAPPFDEKTGFKAQIPIDTIRGLADKLSTAADQGGYRVIIIDPADAMNNAAANALLKMLEEPSKRVIFFLVTANADRLLPTIRSRCQLLRFSQLARDELVEIWPQVSDHPPTDAMRLNLAEGSMRTAFEIDDGYVETYQRIVQVFAGKSNHDGLFSLSTRIAKLGRNEGLAQFGLLMQMAFGRLARIATATTETTPDDDALGVIETQAATLMARNLDGFAALSFHLQGNIRDAMALNLDAETVIFQSLRAIDQLAKAQ